MEQSTWIGRSLNGRYKIDALLGQGGMSSVYKAIDPNLKRVVAIKLIHPHLSTEEDFIHRFKREAAAVAALRHQNIIQVYDFNTDNDVHYMVLEFVPGETLQDRLKHLKSANTKMPVAQAIRAIINVCDALTYAHKQGMIHRDIKPANIMLNVHGDAILMDFGIVKLLDDTTHTATGAVVGTARYMSPEVIRSEVPDERSDIYSLGVTFYEMLSGDPPFDAPSAMSLLMRHLNDPVPDLNSKRDDLPLELIRIVNKSLEKDRENRYRSASEIAGDLRHLLSKLETDSAPTASPSLKADSAIAETKRPAPQIEDQTEPWSTPVPMREMVEPVINEPTRLDQPSPTYNDEKTSLAVEEKPAPSPRQETFKAELKSDAKPVTRAPISPLIKFGGAGLVGLMLLVGGWFAFRNVLSPAPELAATATLTQPVDTATVAIPASTDAPTATPTDELTPTIEPTATNTLPPLYARINNITVNESGNYVVEYETFGYTEQLPGQHIHFFFNTVLPELAATATLTQPVDTATVAIPASTDAPTATPTDEPTPTIEPTATNTLPPLYARINNITVNESGNYVVEYETFGYTEQLPGQHIHFFFNTVLPEQAGMPGSGPWKLYGGPRPFTQYRVVDKPTAATQMCALVANANHSIILESGNCFDLP